MMIMKKKKKKQCGNYRRVGGSTAHLMSSTPLVALVYLSWGVRCNPRRSHYVKNTQIFLSTHRFFKARNAPKFVFGPGPGPRWGSLRRSSRPSSRLGRGRGHPFPIPLPLDAVDSLLTSYSSLRLITTLRRRRQITNQKCICVGRLRGENQRSMRIACVRRRQGHTDGDSRPGRCQGHRGRSATNSLQLHTTADSIQRSGNYNPCPLTLYGHIKTAQQRTIIHQYDDWYTGR